MHECRTEIRHDDELYRLIFPDFVRDGIVSSAAYFTSGKPDRAISVNVARLTTIEETLASRAGRGHYLGVLVARIPHELGLKVEHDPIEGNCAHALIKGAESKAVCARLALETRLPGPRATLGPGPRA